MKLFLFGTGKYAENYWPIIKRMLDDVGIEVVGFVDNNINKVGKNFQGMPIFDPFVLKEREFDKIVVLLYQGKSYDDISNQLINNLEINEKAIISMVDLISICQAMHSGEKVESNKKKQRIYDCFPFFNEYEILEMRLELLNPYVDYFVIVELNRDHRGRVKNYNLKDHWQIVEKFEKKIRYICPSNIPEYKGDGDWSIENFQRNSICQGLYDAEPNDVIGISDCDEIINPDILQRVRNNSNPQGDMLMCLLENSVAIMEQDFHYYYFNLRHKEKWYGSALVKYKNLLEPQIYREFRNDLPCISSGGFHLSYFGSPEKNSLKAVSTVDGIETSVTEIKKRMEVGKDVYGREGNEYEMEILERNEILIPNIDRLISKYPQFYLEVQQ